VVDDWQLGISHVIRGDDHINNTPRQINILQALGAPVPRYAHVPMILGADGKRLSKRHGAVSVLAYRQQGYTPQALLNYLARLGWSHGDDEIFSLDQLVEHFSLEKVNKAPAAFNQSKLDWLNQHYLTHLPREQLVQQLAWQARQQQLDTTQGPALAQVLTVFAERVKTLAELVSSCRYCYEDFTEYEPKAAKKHLRPVAAEGLAQLKQRLAVLQSWDNDALQQVVDDLAAELQVNMGKIAQPLRVAVTGGSSSPGISDTLRLIGQERVIKRIDQALAYIAERAANG
jgi:glutamyl-tRNA synthetase